MGDVGTEVGVFIWIEGDRFLIELLAIFVYGDYFGKAVVGY
jgi:hypothetical protein